MKVLHRVQKDTHHSTLMPSLLRSLKVQKGLLGYSSDINRTRGRISTFAFVFWLSEGTRKPEPASHPVTLFPELSMVIQVFVTPLPNTKDRIQGLANARQAFYVSYRLAQDHVFLTRNLTWVFLDPTVKMGLPGPDCVRTVDRPHQPHTLVSPLSGKLTNTRPD